MYRVRACTYLPRSAYLFSPRHARFRAESLKRRDFAQTPLPFLAPDAFSARLTADPAEISSDIQIYKVSRARICDCNRPRRNRRPNSPHRDIPVPTGTKSEEEAEAQTLSGWIASLRRV